MRENSCIHTFYTFHTSTSANWMRRCELFWILASSHVVKTKPHHRRCITPLFATGINKTRCKRPWDVCIDIPNSIINFITQPSKIVLLINQAVVLVKSCEMNVSVEFCRDTIWKGIGGLFKLLVLELFTQ